MDGLGPVDRANPPRPEKRQYRLGRADRTTESWWLETPVYFITAVPRAGAGCSMAAWSDETGEQARVRGLRR